MLVLLLCFVFTFSQPGTDIQEVLNLKGFSEPRLIIFVNKSNPSLAQGFIAAEKELLFEIDNFLISEGIVSIIATSYCYYISYPTSLLAQSFLLFVQEILLKEKAVSGVKRSSRYSKLVNFILSCYPHQQSCDLPYSFFLVYMYMHMTVYVS